MGDECLSPEGASRQHTPASTTPVMLPSPSSLCSTHDRPMNRRRGVEARKTTLFGKPADREDGRLGSPRNHLIGVWMPVSFIAQRGGGDEEVKRPYVLQISPGMASLREGMC